MTSALEGTIDAVIRKLILDIVAELVKAPSEGGTPVDTGWARANWVPGFGPIPDSPVGTPRSVGAATGAQQAGVARMLGYRSRSGPAFITNNVPYIVPLNEGHSKQAPPGFVQMAITRAIDAQRGPEAPRG